MPPCKLLKFQTSSVVESPYFMGTHLEIEVVPVHYILYIMYFMVYITYCILYIITGSMVDKKEDRLLFLWNMVQEADTTALFLSPRGTIESSKCRVLKLNPPRPEPAKSQPDPRRCCLFWKVCKVGPGICDFPSLSLK